MGNYNGNSSAIGTASHAEKIHRYSGEGAKRSKYKCPYYNRKTKYCNKLGISCVGVTNVLCTGYPPKKKKSLVNRLVFDETLGVGMVMEELNFNDKTIFVVRYKNNDSRRKYFLKELQKKLI